VHIKILSKLKNENKIKKYKEVWFSFQREMSNSIFTTNRFKVITKYKTVNVIQTDGICRDLHFIYRINWTSTEERQKLVLHGSVLVRWDVCWRLSDVAFSGPRKCQASNLIPAIKHTIHWTVSFSARLHLDPSIHRRSWTERKGEANPLLHTAAKRV
jgi:hypothetical protein